MEHPAIVLFDGVCNLCNHSIQFMIKRDPKGYFKFSSLQSEIGQQLLQKYGLPSENMDTIVLIENENVYTYSTAPLRIARKLTFLWPLLYCFIIVPPFIRNPIYLWISRNRYKWFGKKDSCMLPRPDIQQRFL